MAIHAAAPQTPGMAVRAGVDSIEHGLFLGEDDLVALVTGWRLGTNGAAMEVSSRGLVRSSSGGR